MRTHRVGSWNIDYQRLQQEVSLIESLPYSESYSEFVLGRMSRQVMLWAPGGQAGDSVIAHYDTSLAPGPTESGSRMPYLMHLVDQHLDSSRIQFMRLASLSNMVHVPHRDFLEFAEVDQAERPAHRLHVPLVTDQTCLFVEEDSVYRMLFGECWFLDVTKEHGSAVLSDLVRTHLIVDFVDTDDTSTLVRAGSEPASGIPPENLVRREVLPEPVREALPSMANYADRGNLAEIFGVLAKMIYRYQCGKNFFWSTVAEIADRSTDSEFVSHVGGLPEHFMLARSE